MKARSTLLILSLIALSLTVSSAPAGASFHLIKIVEVFAGLPAEPNAQYIELQMYASGQNNVAGHSVIVDTTAGGGGGGAGLTSTFTFTGNVPRGVDQATILVATAEAQSHFGVPADLTMTPVLNATNGKVCFDPEPNAIDCVAWGSHPGSTATGPRFNPATGIPAGSSMLRKTSGGTNPNGLDAGDDTNNSASDFETASPTPQPNTLGGGGGADTEQPTSKITAPKHRTAIDVSQSTNFQGTAKDQGSGDVAKVEIALRQKRKGACKWWNGSGFVSGPCAQKVFVQASGDKKWSYDLPKPLRPTGKTVRNYILYSRATDAAGNVEAEFLPGANKSKFEVFKPPIVCGNPPC